jgi:hypothetical protein
MRRELRTADIARRHGVDRKTAYRWLLQIEKQYGSRVVARRGRRGVLVTTEEAFASVAPLVASREREDRRLRELEERVAELEQRLDALVRTLRARAA